ncbi:MAG: hypothetical protein KJO57_01445, partial [Deltaproteobacteria bacterium]|nr:hypothetical protein [Deltaproteobacteria bacterium]
MAIPKGAIRSVAPERRVFGQRVIVATIKVRLEGQQEFQHAEGLDGLCRPSACQPARGDKVAPRDDAAESQSTRGHETSAGGGTRT